MTGRALTASDARSHELWTRVPYPDYYCPAMGRRCRPVYIGDMTTFAIADMATPGEYEVNRRHGSFVPPIMVDPASKTPLYRQISIWFQRAILARHLQPGQRVPSTRVLARELRISRIPVLSAYELLIAEGYFQSFVGAGTCVSRSIPEAMFRLGRNGGKNGRSIDVCSGAARAISQRASDLVCPAQTWMERCTGCTDLEHFPTGIWSKLVSRYVRKVSRDAMGYGNVMGYGPLREAVAEYLGAFRAVKCDSSQILITTGAQQGLLISALTILNPRDSVWVEEPGYPATHQALRAAGASLVPVAVDEQGLRVEYGIHAANHARAVFVTPSHQYPMSVTMSASRRIELLNWVDRNGAWIVEDDYDSEYRFSGNPVGSLQGLDTNGRVIYVGTFNKVMYPALRLGFVVIPVDLIPGFLNIRNAGDTVSAPMPYQMAMADFIREGHLSRHIKRMRAIYHQRRKSLAAAIGAQSDGLLEIVGEETGMYTLALLPPGINDVEIVTEAQQAGIGAGALSQCYVRPPERGGVMLPYAYSDEQVTSATVDRLKAIICAHTLRH